MAPTAHLSDEKKADGYKQRPCPHVPFAQVAAAASAAAAATPFASPVMQPRGPMPSYGRPRRHPGVGVDRNANL